LIFYATIVENKDEYKTPVPIEFFSILVFGRKTITYCQNRSPKWRFSRKKH